MKSAARSHSWSPPRSAFACFRFPAEVIMVAVRWYLRYGLSYRDVEELLTERGIQVDHVTVYRWVHRFAPLLADAARFTRHSPGDRWFVEETYVKVNGVWRYVYRAVDQHGQVVDVLLTVRRDALAARRFFTRALCTLKLTPTEVVTDAAPVYPGVLAELVPSAWHHVEQYANNPMEADHGPVTRRSTPVATVTLASTTWSAHSATAVLEVTATRPITVDPAMFILYDAEGWENEAEQSKPVRFGAGTAALTLTFTGTPARPEALGWVAQPDGDAVAVWERGGARPLSDQSTAPPPGHGDPTAIIHLVTLVLTVGNSLGRFQRWRFSWPSATSSTSTRTSSVRARFQTSRPDRISLNVDAFRAGGLGELVELGPGGGLGRCGRPAATLWRSRRSAGGRRSGTSCAAGGSHTSGPRPGVRSARSRRLPATLQGIRRYLGSRLTKGIGPVFAERIVEHFGLDTLQIIEDEPTRLVEVPGLGPKRTAKIAATWVAQKGHQVSNGVPARRQGVYLDRGAVLPEVR
ncbi:IS6 family transposase [Actinoplanes sp. NPDC004185]